MRPTIPALLSTPTLPAKESWPDMQAEKQRGPLASEAMQAQLQTRTSKSEAMVPRAPLKDAAKYTLVAPGMMKATIASNLPVPGTGRPVQGIPGAGVDPSARSWTVRNGRIGEVLTVGTKEHDEFTQQSMSKPITTAILIGLLGNRAVENTRALFGDEAANAEDRYALGLKAIGQDYLNEASGTAYNSHKSPEGREDTEYNMSNNKGALKGWAQLRSNTPPGVSPFELYLDTVRKYAGNPNIVPNYRMARGEFEEATNNRELLQELMDKGFVRDEKELNAVLYDYCLACSLTMTTEDASAIGTVLREGVNPKTGERVLPDEVCQYMRTQDRNAGKYNESGQNAPYHAKSGVDGSERGAFVAQRDIATSGHHRDLNVAGNPLESGKWHKDTGKRGELVTMGDLPHLPEGAILEVAPEDLPNLPELPAGVQVVEAKFKTSSRDLHNAEIEEMTDETKEMLRAALAAKHQLTDQAKDELIDSMRVKYGMDTAALNAALELGEEMSVTSRQALLASLDAKHHLTIESKQVLQEALGLFDLSRVADDTDAKNVRIKPMRNVLSLQLHKGGELLRATKNKNGEDRNYFRVRDNRGFIEKLVVAPKLNLDKIEQARNREHLNPEEDK